MNEPGEFGLRMHSFDDEAAGILAYEVDGGELTEALADPLWARFDEAKAGGRKLKLFAQMHAIPGVKGGVIRDKFKRMGTLWSTIDRLAIVGNHGWLDVYTRIVDPITRFEVKHFTSDDQDAALEWLKSPESE